jgi:hypothetical protein
MLSLSLCWNEEHRAAWWFFTVNSCRFWRFFIPFFVNVSSIWPPYKPQISFILLCRSYRQKWSQRFLFRACSPYTSWKDDNCSLCTIHKTALREASFVCAQTSATRWIGVCNIWYFLLTVHFESAMPSVCCWHECMFPSDWFTIVDSVLEKNYLFLKAYVLTGIEPSLTHTLNRTILYFTHIHI